MLREVEVAGLRLVAATKPQLLTELSARIKAGSKTFLTTLYSEFLYNSLRDREVHAILSKADLAIADGVGILWADYFLRQKFTTKNYYLKIFQACAQVVYTGASILLRPKKLYEVFPEKIVGADLFWDLAEMAERENFSVYLIGWYDQKTEQVAEALKAKYPEINIVGFSNTTPDDEKVVEEIKTLSPDMVLVAFGPLKQERWIAKNLSNLPIKFVVGLGGSFDYAIGKKIAPPKFIRSIGLEWLYRLITQPHRAVRIYQAFWGLIVSLVRYKVFQSMPYRENAIAVVVNKENKVLLCERAPAPPKNGSGDFLLVDYWQFPQGGLDEGEEIIAGGKRELFEETGIKSIEVIGLSQRINSYEWTNALRPLWFQKYHFKGQEQQTLFAKFVGQEDEIRLDNRELVKYEWLAKEELLKRIAEERKEHASLVLEELFSILEKRS